MFDIFKEIPLRVKLAIGILSVLYILLLVLATPVALLFGVLGLGMWAVVTIIQYFV